MKITWADLCCRLTRNQPRRTSYYITRSLTSKWQRNSYLNRKNNKTQLRIFTVCSSRHRNTYSKLKVALDYGTYMKRWTSWKPPCIIQTRKYKTLATTWTETSTESNLNWRRWPRRSSTKSFIQLKKLKCWKLTIVEWTTWASPPRSRYRQTQVLRTYCRPIILTPWAIHQSKKPARQWTHSSIGYSTRIRNTAGAIHHLRAQEKAEHPITTHHLLKVQQQK